MANEPTHDPTTGKRRHGQRGQIIPRGPKTYLLRVPRGRNPETGARRYHSETFHGTKKAAQEKLTALMGKEDAGILVEPTTVTVNELLDRWLAMMVHQVGPHTHDDYTNVLRRYVRPVLGTALVRKITPADVDAVYTAMRDRGLTVRTIRYVHATMRQALRQAVRWRLLATNPALDASPPRASSRRAPVRAFTPEQAAAFLDAAQHDEYGTLFAFALATGMRPGEIFGLRWPDVDLEKGTVTVKHTLIPYGEGGWSLVPPKTAGSRRTIDLPASVTTALRAHKAAQAAARLAAGPDWTAHDLVFCTTTGGPLDLRNLVRRHFKPILKVAGLPHEFRLYDLRHSCATLLLAQGEHVKVVSERLGHASTTLTLDTYTHVLPTMQKTAAARLERLLFGK